MNPFLQQLISEASELHRSNDLNGAEKVYKKVLKEMPKNADVLNLLGLVYVQQNKLEEAIKSFLKAIDIDQKNEFFHRNLGEAYLRKKEYQASLEAHRQSVKVNPKFVEGYLNMGNTLKYMGKYFDAINYYKEAIQKDFKNEQAHFNLGITTKEMGRYEQAKKYFSECLVINEQHELAHYHLGLIYLYWKQFDLAIEQFQEIIQINPNHRNAQIKLAQTYAEIGDTKAAVNCFAAVRKLDDEDPLAILAAATIHPIIFDSSSSASEYLQNVEEVLQDLKPVALNPANLQESLISTFSDLIYSPSASLKIKEKVAAFYEGAMPKIEALSPADKPHVGFVVWEGNEEQFLRYMKKIVNQLNNESFRVTVVCSQPFGYRKLEPEITNMSVQFLSLPQRFDLAAQTMLNAKFDFIYYWQVGTTIFNYFLPFIRLAKVQCTSVGWPTSSGISTLDYFIATKRLSVENESFSENLIEFEYSPVLLSGIEYNSQSLDLTKYDLPTHQTIYFCPSNLRKIHPDFDELIREILSKDPNGVVLFITDEKPIITQKLQTRFQNSLSACYKQVVFMDGLSMKEQEQLLNSVDVVLDSLYYGIDYHTGVQAIVHGKPVITLPGDSLKGRFVYEIYEEINNHECIAKGKKEYVEKAVTIGKDHNLREKLSAKLKGGAKNLFNNEKTTIAEFEEFISNSLSQ